MLQQAEAKFYEEKKLKEDIEKQSKQKVYQE